MTRSASLGWLTLGLLVVLGILLGYMTGFLSVLSLFGIPIVVVATIGWVLWRELARRKDSG